MMTFVECNIQDPLLGGIHVNAMASMVFTNSGAYHITAIGVHRRGQ